MNDLVFIHACVLVSWNFPLRSASAVLMCHCWKLSDAAVLDSPQCRAMERLVKVMETKTVMEFFGKCQRSLGHALPLSSLLIKPVQRILRYKLLLEVSCTPTTTLLAVAMLSLRCTDNMS